MSTLLATWSNANMWSRRKRCDHCGNVSFGEECNRKTTKYVASVVILALGVIEPCAGSEYKTTGEHGEQNVVKYAENCRRLQTAYLTLFEESSSARIQTYVCVYMYVERTKIVESVSNRRNTQNLRT